jgi:hypothetical protein
MAYFLWAILSRYDCTYISEGVLQDGNGAHVWLRVWLAGEIFERAL